MGAETSRADDQRVTAGISDPRSRGREPTGFTALLFSGTTRREPPGSKPQGPRSRRPVIPVNPATGEPDDMSFDPSAVPTLHAETQALHAGKKPDPSTNARAVPIYAT